MLEIALPGGANDAARLEAFVTATDEALARLESLLAADRHPVSCAAPNPSTDAWKPS